MLTEGDPANGACLCGAVRFTVLAPTIFCTHCHCSICRRFHGAAFGTWFGVRRDRLSFEAGQSELAHFRSSDHGRRSFCRRCGSPLFFESTNRPEEVEIVLAAMVGPIDRKPESHMHSSERVEWTLLEGDLPRSDAED